MPRFSANISTLFREVPLTDRVGLAAEVGFDGIEIQFPYAADPHLLRSELIAYELPLVLMNFPAGDLMDGGEGLAAVPGREDEFARCLREAREYAKILQPRAMNLLAGRPGARQDKTACDAAFRASLQRAADLTRDLGIQLLTEPVNTVDLPGFYLNGSQQAIELIDAMPEIGLRMQYDLYHMEMMESDLPTRLPEIIGHVGHIQFSDAPGRTEPGLGSIDFESLFALIDSLDYRGFVGAEYFPTKATHETLGWLDRYRRG
jgi:hydroxypyruvate isomerase